MTATFNPQAAADQARKNYLGVTTQLGHLGLDGPPERKPRKQLAKCGSRQPTHSNHISAQLNRRHVKSF
jgi:hypothetical protein